MKTWMLAVVMVAMMGAAPATRPSTQPTEAQQLRKIIAGLQMEIANLKRDNQLLSQKLADAKVPATMASDDKMQKSITERRLEIGMTLQEAERSLGRNETLIAEDSNVKTYRWYIGNVYTMYGTFRDGRLISFERHD